MSSVSPLSPLSPDDFLLLNTTDDFLLLNRTYEFSSTFLSFVCDVIMKHSLPSSPEEFKYYEELETWFNMIQVKNDKSLPSAGENTVSLPSAGSYLAIRAILSEEAIKFFVSDFLNGFYWVKLRDCRYKDPMSEGPIDPLTQLFGDLCAFNSFESAEYLWKKHTKHLQSHLEVKDLKEFIFFRMCESADLKFIQWFYYLFTENPINIHWMKDCCYSYACGHGKLDTVKWLDELGNQESKSNPDDDDYNIPNSKSGFYHACKNGHLETAQYIYTNQFKKGYFDIYMRDAFALRKCLYNNQGHVARWLLNIDSNGWSLGDKSEMTFTGACYHGDLEIVKIIWNKYKSISEEEIEQRYFECSSQYHYGLKDLLNFAFVGCVQKNHEDVAQWIIDTSQEKTHFYGPLNYEFRGGLAFIWACGNGNLKLAQMIWKNSGCIKNLGMNGSGRDNQSDPNAALAWACMKNHVDVVNWLWDYVIDNPLTISPLDYFEDYIGIWYKTCEGGSGSDMTMAKFVLNKALENNATFTIKKPIQLPRTYADVVKTTFHQKKALMELKSVENIKHISVHLLQGLKVSITRGHYDLSCWLAHYLLKTQDEPLFDSKTQDALLKYIIKNSDKGDTKWIDWWFDFTASIKKEKETNEGKEHSSIIINSIDYALENNNNILAEYIYKIGKEKSHLKTQLSLSDWGTMFDKLVSSSEKKHNFPINGLYWLIEKIFSDPIQRKQSLEHIICRILSFVNKPIYIKCKSGWYCGSS